MRGSDFLPLGSRLVSLIKGAMDHYVTLSAIAPEERRGLVVLWVRTQVDGWKPEIKGVQVMDPSTKEAAAELIGGIAFLVADELNKRGAA